jgi:hypothetical protein
MKYMESGKNLSVLKWLKAGASDDESHPVLTSILIKPDGSLITANGFQLHWIRNLELATEIMNAVGHLPNEHDVMVTPVKVQKITAFEDEPMEGNYPEVERIVPNAAPATFRVNAKELSEAVSGFDMIASFAPDLEKGVMQVSGNTKADYAGIAHVAIREPGADSVDWKPWE